MVRTELRIVRLVDLWVNYFIHLLLILSFLLERQFIWAVVLLKT